MSVTLIDEIAASRGTRILPLSVDQYHEMIRGGIIPAGTPVELIDGVLTWKDRSREGGERKGHDPRHALLITRLLQLLQDWVRGPGCHLRIQLPVTLTDSNEPEPDVAVIFGSPERFAARHPGPADVPLVIEVADSSLKADQTTKQRLYAKAGIPAYWIVNLRSNQVEVYEQAPSTGETYQSHSNHGPGETLTLRVRGQELTVDLAALLA